jgi:hypothetical protein
MNNLPSSNIDCVESSAKFILLEIAFDNKELKIDLKQANANYYVEGNVLNAQFIRYLLKQYYKVEQVPTKYKLKIIDQWVNWVELDESQTITIEENE